MIKLPHDCSLSFSEVVHSGCLQPVPFEKITLFSKELDRGFSQFVRLQPLLPVYILPGLYPLVVRIARRLAIWRLKRLVRGAKIVSAKIGY